MALRTFFPFDPLAVIKELGKDRLISTLKRMLLIRQFEQRAEAAYQQGKIGGFFHSYAGQEAIQLAAVEALGLENWYVTTYRCHALALLLGATPDELMAELFGRVTGNAKGRGGSMHFFTNRMLGGFGIVGGHIPIAVGAAFSIKYQKKNEVAICFLGDGAVAQGSFHESLNLASLWNLPCIFVIENNVWGMGTHVEKAVAVKRLAEDQAPSYAMKGFSFDGTDFFACYAGFKHVFQETLSTSCPVLIEALAERFRGHSISDPGTYRSKEDLKKVIERDPVMILKKTLMEHGLIDEEGFKEMEKEVRDVVLAALKFADESPWPHPATLEEDVLAP